MDFRPRDVESWHAHKSDDLGENGECGASGYMRLTNLAVIRLRWIVISLWNCRTEGNVIATSGTVRVRNTWYLPMRKLLNEDTGVC
jgi:hypothetical protein